MKTSRWQERNEVNRRLSNGETLRMIAPSLGITAECLSYHRKLWGDPRLPRHIRAVADKYSGRPIIRTGCGKHGIGFEYEHIVVAQQTIGRKIRRDELVHHINGDKCDNSPSNLFVCKRKNHMSLHYELECLSAMLVQSGGISFNGSEYYWTQGIPKLG